MPCSPPGRGAHPQRSAEGLRRLGVGGTAVGSGLNAHPEYHVRMVENLSELTGLELHSLTICSNRCNPWPMQPIFQLRCARWH
jgi:hypothetical protein